MGPPESTGYDKKGESMISEIILKLKKNQFLFEELVKRDFKQKYKRTALGMAWSILSPLITLLVLNVIFSNFFGQRIPHYTIYLFCGNLLFSYFSESTNSGMNSLMANSGIFSKVNVPKYIFLLSKNVSSLINFGLTLIIFFAFVFAEGLPFTAKFLCLLYPISCLIIFNIGMGLILSALFVFFRDIGYLYSILTMLIMYASAIFYSVDILPGPYQPLFLGNPIYVYIKYFREIVIDSQIPSLEYHLLCAFYAVLVLFIGGFIYKKYNHKFLYYI
ncbi:ABC transporter permease [Megasphaera elsdenii]|uniref:ABC transporter permease n=1 Tax=Megasphaera elsdenii TaxID=907 RepID=UPI003F7FD575